MKVRNKAIIALLIVMLCIPVMSNFKNVNAVTAIPESQLPTNRGDQVTGDDIVNTGRYLYGLNFTYNSVGTCTGFVTRILRYLEVGIDLVSRDGDWNYIYNLSNWNRPGVSPGAAYGPDKWKTQADKMVANGNAEYIGVIPDDNPKEAQNLGIQNGDLLITPKGNAASGHVAIAIIENGVVKSFGAAGSGITVLNFENMYSEKRGDTYVYRLAASTGDLLVHKVDQHGKNIAGVTFHITGPNVDGNYVTDGNGIIELNGVSFGDYTITEVAVPAGSNMVLNTTPMYATINGSANRVTVESTNYYQRGKARVHKVDSLEGEDPKGDAKLSGATYALYASEDIYEGSTKIYSANQQVGGNVTTGENGYTDYITELPIGNYYWKEINPSEGFLLNAKTVPITISYQGETSTEAVESTATHEEEKIYQRAKVVKMDNNPDSSEEDAAVGAILKLTLISDPTQYYTAEIQEDGTAEFIDWEFKEEHPDEEYTIPYGTYEISEEKESDAGEHTHFFFQKYTVVLDEDNKTETVIFSDEPVAPYLKIVKTDAITGLQVNLEGAKFKVWDCQNNEFVEQMETPSGHMITEYIANENGEVTLPERLQPGKYIIYETAAPAGYSLNPEWAIPENEDDIGVEGKGGKVVDLTKETIGVAGDAEYDKDLVLIYKEEMPDYPLLVKLQINKTGEMLTEVKTETVKYQVSESGETNSEEKFTPVFTLRGLPGVTYNIVAAEDIKSPDGNGTYANAGDVVDTITTGEDGTAITKDIYPGTYSIEEIVTPKGYVKDENIEDVTLTNTDQATPVKTYEKDLTNVRQKLELTFLKKFEEPKFKVGEEEVNKKAIFGVYTNQEIYNYTGAAVMPKDALVDLIEIEGETDVTSTIDLPEGKYYVKELFVSYPYTPNTEVRNFDLKYTDDSTQEFVVYKGEDMINTTESASLTLVKLSTDIVDKLSLIGPDIDMSELDEETQKIVEELKGMTVDQVKEYLKENQIEVVPGATYGVYLDEDCKQPLQKLDDTTGEYVDVKIVTDESGLITLNDLPLGTYYIKELIAPPTYALSDEVIKVSLTTEQKDTMIFQGVVESEPIEAFLTKTDAFTGEEIPNCKFEITDVDGNVIFESTTDVNGKGYLPISKLENGETYYWNEIEAPDIYDLNTEPHPFVASYDEETMEWTAEQIEVDNLRKTREVIVRKLDAETGEALKGCVFTIAMIDPETGEQKVNPKTGEPIYLVENAETDENGEYVIKEAPMGTYKFLEIKAPEGYELDEDLTGLVFTIDNDSPETIIFEVTNTGDIAVIAISGVALLSIAGIIFILKRKNVNA